MKLKKTILLLVLIISYSYICAENWVGQAATYQLVEGTLTAGKEPFSGSSLTAASNGFKLGAKVEVTNLNPFDAKVEVTNANTGKMVQVTINDRIEGDSKYFILLSPAAAKEINLEWETGLVVVSADFNALNSTERLPIGGLLPEDEHANEYKILQKIEWPNENVIEEQTILDVTDDKIFEEQTIPDVTDDEIAPSQESFHIAENTLIPSFTPERNITVNENTPLIAITIPEEILIPSFTPVRKKAIDVSTHSFQIDKEDLIIPVVPEKSIEAKVEDTKMNFKDIPWTNKLDPEKNYIKFFSSSKHDDFAIKYFNFNTLFGGVIAVRRGNIFHLVSKPIDEKNLNQSINTIRNFGFRDAYIIKGDSW